MPDSDTKSFHWVHDILTKADSDLPNDCSMKNALISSPPPKEVSQNDIENGSNDANLPLQPSAHPGFNPADFPDGGLEAWVVVFGGSLILFCSFGIVNCSGIFVDYYINGPLSGYSSSSITWITSVQTFIVTGSNLFMGRIFDNYGTRWTLPIGTLVYAFGLMALSLSTKYYQIILSQGVVCGIGGAAVFNCANNATLTWFLKHRAAAMGIVYAGSSVGGVVFPILISHLIPRIGFPWTMRVLGFIVLALCGVACFTVKSHMRPQPKPFAFYDLIKPLSERRFLFLVLGNFFVYWGIFLPFNYLTIQAEQQGVNPVLVPYILPIINAFSVPGRIMPGLIADRFGRFNMIIVICVLSTIVTLALWIPGTSTAAIIVYGAFHGFASGGFISVSPVVIAQISDLREIGSRSGVSLFIGSLGALTGAPIGGAILSAQHGDYIGLKLFAGLSMLIGGFLFILSRAAQVKFKITKI